LLAVTCAPDVVTAAFQELVTVSAALANENPVFHPAMGTDPLLVTVNWTWKPPDQEVTIDEVRAQAPAGAALPVELGEGLADGLDEGLGDELGDEDALGDGLGDAPPPLLV